MSLKITQEPMEDRQLAVTIEVPQERIDQELRKAARKLGRTYRIPGFRKGKAPYHIIVQNVGLPALYQEFIDDLGQEVYKQAVEDKAFEPYAMAALNDIDVDPVRYKLVVPLEPEVDLGDYRSLRIEEEEIEIDDEEIDEQLEEYQEEYSTWEDADRPSQYGDLMVIDVYSVLDEPLEGDEETVVLDETDWEITPDEEDPMDPPGFDEALLGLKVGDKKEISLSWPEDGESIYAGKSALFKIEVKQVKLYNEIEIDDELAQMIGPDFETVEDLRESVRETLYEEEKRLAEDEYLEEVMARLRDGATLVYPPVVIEDQLDMMINEFEQMLQRAGIGSIESYFEATDQDLDAFRESQRESATEAAERNLIISEIINAEGLVATEEEIVERVREIIGDDGSEEDEQSEQVKNMFETFVDGPGRPMIESQVLNNKAIDRILAIARGEEVPDPAPVADTSDAEDAEVTDESANEATSDREDEDADATSTEDLSIETASDGSDNINA